MAALTGPEALEERGGPLDVGEEEGDRPGRQNRHVRPPGGASGAANNQRRSAGVVGFPRRLVPAILPSDTSYRPFSNCRPVSEEELFEFLEATLRKR